MQKATKLTNVFAKIFNYPLIRKEPTEIHAFTHHLTITGALFATRLRLPRKTWCAWSYLVSLLYHDLYCTVIHTCVVMCLRTFYSRFQISNHISTFHSLFVCASFHQRSFESGMQFIEFRFHETSKFLLFRSIFWVSMDLPLSRGISDILVRCPKF